MVMFRPMRRNKQEVSEETCREILKNEKRAVLSVIGDEGYPYAVPVDFYYDEEEDLIYLHGAREGHKIDAIRASDKVCFTLWGKEEKPEDDWAYFVTSVIIFGRAELVKDEEIILDKTRKIGLKYYPSREEVEDEIKKAISRVQLIRIRIEHMSGKRVHEK